MVLTLITCRKEDSTLAPTIRASLSPSSGNTNQTFIFDLSQSVSNINSGPKLFTRWDWDGDGIWDTPFTRLLIYEHRYYAPGTWKPRIEMTNQSGGIDTLSLIIPVTRGYSAPKIVFHVTPSEGNILTGFQLDASATRDDEDSVDQLKFRWDFEGDGEWDTHFTDSAKPTHRYSFVGIYPAKVQVKDPSGLISTATANVTVTLIDPQLIASFRCTPDSVLNDTTTIMDASASICLGNPDTPLQYRWDWNNDLIWDTEWTSNPQTPHVFKEEFIHFVRLEIKSPQGLINHIVQRIRVYHKNEAPQALFASSTIAGNVNTKFRLDCWPTRDRESSPSAMFYRWDFDGDGQWDTDFTSDVVTFHQFPTPGKFKTILQVKDPLGATDTCAKWIYVSHGSNQTDIIEDKRGAGYQYYGTVHIGDQWWMTRNLCVQDTEKYYQFFYNDEFNIYHDYGNLYQYNYLKNICPDGWRIPSKDDWNKLFANYPEDQLFDALMPGGVSDFSAVMGGKGLGSSRFMATYDGIDRYAYYWSTSQPKMSTVSIWIIAFDTPQQQVLRGFYPLLVNENLYSVRCMKDAK